MQSVPFRQIDCCHPRTPPSSISLVVLLDLLNPEIPDILITVLSKANVNQEIAELLFRLKIVSLTGNTPLLDERLAEAKAIPTAEFASALTFTVKRRAKGDDACDLCDKTCQYLMPVPTSSICISKGNPSINCLPCQGPAMPSEQ